MTRTKSPRHDVEGLPTSDQALIRALAEDDQATIAAFDAKVRPRMMSFARRQGLTREEAEDVVQEALLAAYKQLSSQGFNGGSAIATWITGILDHNVKDALRRRYRQRESLIQQDELKEPIIYDTADRERIQQVLLAMPSRERLVLLLNVHAGKPAREIAPLLGLGTKTTEALLTKARKHFRELFLATRQENGPMRRLKG